MFRFYSMLSLLIFASYPIYTMHLDTGEFVFPAQSVLSYSDDRSIDVSGLSLDISNMLKGGIGYGANATILLARGMEAIGSNDRVTNAPYCLHRRLSNELSAPYKLYDINSNLVDSISIDVSKTDALNIALDIDGHASLASLRFHNGQIEKILFYDSLAPAIINYEARYNEQLLETLLNCVNLNHYLISEIPMTVIHALDQGDKHSHGCGYYSLFTAMLLKNGPDWIQDQYKSSYLYDQTKDHYIRASLAVITFMHEGIWRKLSLKYDELGIRNCVFHLLQMAEYELAKKLEPFWRPLNGHESNMELWVKYNDAMQESLMKLGENSEEYQAILASPSQNYEQRLSAGEDIRQQASKAVWFLFANRLSQERLSQFLLWASEQGYRFVHRV